MTTQGDAGAGRQGSLSGLAALGFLLASISGFALPAQAQTQGPVGAQAPGAEQQETDEEKQAEEAIAAPAEQCVLFNGKACTKPKWPPCLKKPWGVYISPGFAPGVNWGGYHVTIAGFSKLQACPIVGGMEKAVRQAWHDATFPPGRSLAFHFKSTEVQEIHGPERFGVSTAHPNGKGWWMWFKSSDLNNFSRYLVSPNDFDCRRMKGPYCALPKTVAWHVTLCEFAYDKNCNLNNAVARWNSIKNKTWHFYKVRLPPPACQKQHKCVQNGYWEQVK